MYWYFYIPCIAFILLGLVGAASSARKQKEKEAFLEFYHADKDAGKALDSKSVVEVEAVMNNLKYVHDKNVSLLSENDEAIFKDDLEELSIQIEWLERSDWEKKALPYLEKFSQSYSAIMSGVFENFKNVDALFSEKKKCIRAWQSYFHIDLEDYKTTIYPKRYMREYMGDDYDPCMESHDELERKLDTRIQAMRPEYKRKMRCYDILINHIAEKESIRRSILFKTAFDGYSQDEIKCVYQELLKKNRIFEIKLGDRWFVSLSDKEKEKIQ